MRKIILFLFLVLTLAGNVQAYDNGIRDNPAIVKQVADFKIGDEKLAKDFETVENNREFERKMAKIMEKLNNKKMRDSKNREVINILNEAGDKLYNLLAN